MNKPSEIESARIKRDAQKIAKAIKNTPLNQRGYLFSAVATHFDNWGEVPMATLFARIASTYVRRKK